MSISFIVILGLPVLFLTGSLKRIVLNTGVSQLGFILFFFCTAAFSFLPALKIIQTIRINFAGAFFCIAPAVYLAVKRKYSYRYYLVFVLTVLLAVGLSFFVSIYSIPYLQYIVDLVIALAASICFMPRGPIFAPVMMGVYGIAGGLMQLFSGMDSSIVLFGNTDMTTLCTALCLFVSYLLRPRGRHAVGRVLQT